MALTHDIQIGKNNKQITSCLFMDIKGAFDHVSINQLLKICQKLQLPISLCKWIESFMSDRQIQLAFDGEKYRKVQIKTGIPQGSPVSPILFLIYISFLFKNEADNIYIKFLSYLDDIAIIASGESAQENCQALKIAALKLIQWGKENTIDFDSEKTELIHFQNKRDPDGAEIQLNESLIIKPKIDVKWLGI